MYSLLITYCPYPIARNSIHCVKNNKQNSINDKACGDITKKYITFYFQKELEEQAHRCNTNYHRQNRPLISTQEVSQ